METTENIDRVLAEHGWNTVATLNVPGREAVRKSLDPGRVTGDTHTHAEGHFTDGLYKHQTLAVERFSNGENVCLATGTSSGKTGLFHLAAIETLSKKPNATILCLYPLKALASEQEQRWRTAFGKKFGRNSIGRIAGDIPTSDRLPILRRAKVVVATPDVLHAWMLPHCSDQPVRQFLRNLQVVVIDEAHAYAGVFGSNSAFLFRRLRHLCALLNANPQFVAASATIANASLHLRKLTGVDFTIIGEEENGAKRYPVKIRLAERPDGAELMNCLPKLISDLAAKDRRVLAFVDSRKQVELVTSIMAREPSEVADDAKVEIHPKSDDEDDIPILESNLQFLSKLAILPYRSGYEEVDRLAIQNRLEEGNLNGVVSTSALELGIDIPLLDVCILLGVPASSTSLHQRIGRIGRHKPGEAIVINAGTISDRAIFADPETLLTRPLAESALYLENIRIQYIHALCLARLGGEHDSIAKGGAEDPDFYSTVEFPPGFIELCQRERTGQIEIELQSMKGESGETPSYAFPLRDVETQFKLVLKQGPEQMNLGQLSYSQAIREAYPGAIYRYATRAFRVYSVSTQNKEIKVRKERSFITKPSPLPTLVFPNLTDGNVYNAVSIGSATLVEANLQIRESIAGFSERRGPNEKHYSYPLESVSASLFYRHKTFFRNYFTSGVLLFHPALEKEGVNREIIQAMLMEAFLMVAPYDRADISSASDKLRTNWRLLTKGSRFLSLYDSTYGSLRLSGRLLEEKTVMTALGYLSRLPTNSECDANTLSVINEIASCALGSFLHLDVGEINENESTEDQVRVISPGSLGIKLGASNVQIQIEKVYWNAKEGQLFYRGFRETEQPGNSLIIPVDQVLPIPGVSVMKLYDLETGDLVEL